MTPLQRMKKKKYWMAYMEMKPELRNALLICLFIFNITIVLAYLNVGDILNFLGSTTIPLMIYVFPGYIFY
jgi:hypothetical protein